MVVTEELLNNRLEKERAFILEAVTGVVHEVLYRDDSEMRSMLEQLKATRVELANLTELMKAYRVVSAMIDGHGHGENVVGSHLRAPAPEREPRRGSRRFDQWDNGAAPEASDEKGEV